MRTGFGCLTIIICVLLTVYFGACRKEIDYFIFPSKFREATYYEKFDALRKGSSTTIKIKQNYICEHSFAIVYFRHREGDIFSMGNTGKFQIKLSSSGKILEEKIVALYPDKSTPGAALLPDCYRHELYIFTFDLTPECLKDAELTVTVLEPMTNLEELRGEIYAAILPTWRL